MSHISAEQNVPHRRFNQLTQSWVLCSPHRAKRPWQGQVEKPSVDSLPQYDPKCFLCPRNQRINTTPGVESPFNPDYKGTFVFGNDFSALLPEGQNPTPSSTSPENEDLFQSSSASGICKVICFSPRHDLTLSQMKVEEIEEVVKTWTEEYKTLNSNPDIKYVQIFENRGEMMGCSNPHPHCQIWSSSFVPQDPLTELHSFEKYFGAKKSCLLCDYVRLELEKKERIVVENEKFVALVPYWALWPYEVLVLPKEHKRNLLEFDEADSKFFADILNKVTCKYDNLFQSSFPYSMGLHQSPTDSGNNELGVKMEGSSSGFHFHTHFFPPLLRSATVKKFMVGYEMLGEPQRDITAEQSAATLRGLSHEVHYKTKLSQEAKQNPQ